MCENFFEQMQKMLYSNDAVTASTSLQFLAVRRRFFKNLRARYSVYCRIDAVRIV